MLEDIIEAMPNGCAVLASDLSLVAANGAFAEMFEDAEVGQSLEGWAQGALNADDNLAEAIKAETVQFEFQRRDGLVAFLTSKRTPSGQFLVTAERIGHRSTAQEMLFDAFQAFDEGMVLCDEQMRYIFGNDAWKSMMFGPDQIGAPEPGDSVIENLIRHIQSGFYKIPDYQTPQEYTEWMMGEMAQHGKQVPFESADGRHFIGSSHLTGFGGSLLFVREVTKQHNVEQKRLEAVNDAIDSVDYPLVLFSADKKFVLANAAWYEIFKSTGMKPKAGDDGEDFFWANIDSGFYVVPEGWTKETMFRTGLDFIYNYDKEWPLVTREGRIHMGSSHKTALGGFLLSFRDITDQRNTEAELETQREIAHQNEKLSALGELLAGVAHELNNPLSVVFGYSQMLQGKLSDPVMSERVDLICQSAERAAKIVRTFLAMARQRPAKVAVCPLNEIVTTALEVSSYSLKSNGTQVLTNLEENVAHVRGDFDQLAQVFSNLVVNAGHAVEEQGEAGQIHVKCYYEKASDSHVVEIADNGPGIPADVVGRIFEPFFTTKEVGSGTGIGLAFSHRIINAHGGTLSVKSSVGRGTTFFVKLKAEVQKEPTVPVDETRIWAGQTALVVDDEAGIVQLMSDLLRDEGLKVTTTTSPVDALRLMETKSFDFILSDFKMPDMSGDIFYRAMQTIAPECAKRAGFITGDALSENVREFLKAAKRPHIEKPIIKEELMGLIQVLADGKGE